MEQEQIKEVSIEQISKMSIDEIVDLYNPANAQYLSTPALDYLSRLTNEEVSALASKYPNKSTGNTYLILKDNSKKATEKQIYPRSTWANLHQLRSRNALNYVAISFASRFKSESQTIETNVKIAPVQDLTNAEKEALPGLKMGAAQTSEPVKEEKPNVKPLEPIVEPQKQTLVNDEQKEQVTGNGPLNDEDEDLEDLSEEAAKHAGANEVEENANTVTIKKSGRPSKK